jgi:hypothetical protein
MKFTASAIASIALLGLFSPVIAQSAESTENGAMKASKQEYGAKSPSPHKSHKKSSSTGTPTPTPTGEGYEEESEEALPEEGNLYGNSALVLKFAAIPAVAILFAI